MRVLVPYDDPCVFVCVDSCSGNEACIDAIIDGAAYNNHDGEQKTKLFCYGRNCAKNALIKEVAYIVVSGSMPGALIDAGTLPSDIPMTIKMRGYQSGLNVTIKARLQTKAILLCQSYNACEGLLFDCFDSMGKGGRGCKISPQSVCWMRIMESFWQRKGFIVQRIFDRRMQSHMKIGNRFMWIWN